MAYSGLLTDLGLNEMSYRQYYDMYCVFFY